MNNVLSLTGLAGVTVIAGSNFVANQTVINNASIATGTYNINGTSIGTAELPVQTIRQNIIGLGSGNQFSKTVTNVGSGFDEGQVIKGASTGIDYSNIVSDRINRQYTNRALAVGPNQDMLITIDGRYYSAPDQEYFNPPSNINLTNNTSSAGSSENQNYETYSFGGLTRASGIT
jgi:hypothetical protein